MAFLPTPFGAACAYGIVAQENCYVPHSTSTQGSFYPALIVLSVEATTIKNILHSWY